jgi:hypothetical protein
MRQSPARGNAKHPVEFARRAKTLTQAAAAKAEVNMKTLLATLISAALVTGCAHNNNGYRGGVGEGTYRDTGGTTSRDMRSPTDQPIGYPNTMQRDFPGRVQPGSDRFDNDLIR